MTPRERRLGADAAEMRDHFFTHPWVEMVPMGWFPQDAYRITFTVPSAQLEGDSNQPIVAEEHTVLVTLPVDYPRVAPTCRAESSVFHPAISPEPGGQIDLCMAWSPHTSLVEVVGRLASILQYQVWWSEAPRNAVAARWAARNEAIFPLGTAEIDPVTTPGSP